VVTASRSVAFISSMLPPTVRRVSMGRRSERFGLTRFCASGVPGEGGMGSQGAAPHELVLHVTG
jgi:hypothetical protein